MSTIIDVIFNAGEHAEAFAEILTTLQVTTFAGVDGVNVKFCVDADRIAHVEEFRAAVETLFAANFGEQR